MQRLTENKIILVTRPTRVAELKRRFNTRTQAKFYVSHLGQDFSDYEREDEHYANAVATAQQLLSAFGRLQLIDRSFLPNFVFGPQDVVVVLGQDGLVANTVKYLNGQPVIGVNPDPARWDGQLLPFRLPDLTRVLPEVFARKRTIKSVTMAQATLNTGQKLYAVNDLFIGPRSHISARYKISFSGKSENHSSSGIIVSTGVGSTGWFKSLLAGASGILQGTDTAKQPGRTKLVPKSEFAWDAGYLCFTVREPFPSKTTQAGLVFGRVTTKQSLVIESQMPENGVIFSDGIENDFLEFRSGVR
ncbi:MAG: sugar kinase, partial [Verrucomicrobiota bacterium]